MTANIFADTPVRFAGRVLGHAANEMLAARSKLLGRADISLVQNRER
jgi:hypothetical protein